MIFKDLTTNYRSGLEKISSGVPVEYMNFKAEVLRIRIEKHNDLSNSI